MPPHKRERLEGPGPGRGAAPAGGVPSVVYTGRAVRLSDSVSRLGLAFQPSRGCRVIRITSSHSKVRSRMANGIPSPASLLYLSLINILK